MPINSKYEFTVVFLVAGNIPGTIRTLDEYGKYGWQVVACNSTHIIMQRETKSKGDIE